MRLWSLHPKHLDAKGLSALWREGLLAQHVLTGQTNGYRHHPQLERFKEQADPVAAIHEYLRAVLREAQRRQYRFNPSKIPPAPSAGLVMEVTEGQLNYEWRHLKAKLRQRTPHAFEALQTVIAPEAHPSFTVIAGPTASWERI